MSSSVIDDDDEDSEDDIERENMKRSKALENNQRNYKPEPRGMPQHF
jgi:hypothetical protein